MGPGRPQEAAEQLATVTAAIGPVVRQLMVAANEMDVVPLAALAIEFTNDGSGGDEGAVDGCALFFLSRDEADARASSGEPSPEWFWMPHFWDGQMAIVEFAAELQVAAYAAVQSIFDTLRVEWVGAKGLFFDLVGRDVVSKRLELVHPTREDFVVFAARHQNFEAGLLDSMSWTAGTHVTSALQRVGLLPTQVEVDQEGDEWSRLG